MTLKELVLLIDPNQDMTDEEIEVVVDGGEWDEFETLHTHSKVLESIWDRKVKALGATGDCRIRVDLEWSDATR